MTSSVLSTNFLTGVGIGIGISFFFSHFVNRSVPVGCEHEQEEDEEWETDSEDDEEEEEEDEGKALTIAPEAKGPMKMVLVVRTDLKMGKGKAAAQCCHAALAAYKKAKANYPLILKNWERGGQAKVTVKTETEDDLLTIMAMAKSLGLVTAIIQDAGRTQIEAGSKTVVAVGPGPESIIDQVTSHLKLY
jgi:PTH2 family peptidyl-tRNA hydrolase